MKRILYLLIFLLPIVLSSQVQVIDGTYFGKTKAFRDLSDADIPQTKETTDKYKKNWKGIPNFTSQIPMPEPNADKALPKDGDPLLESSKRTIDRGPVILEVNVDGTRQSEAGGVLPPDPDGDSGASHYIQAVNGNGTTIRIFDLEGNVIDGPKSLNSLWSPFGVSGLGDPIILYDQEADRWILTEFQLNGNALLVAVSATSDPLGEYHAYRFPTPSFPDYPKFGIWGDAIYITTNEFINNFIPIYVIDRQALLNGEDTDMIRLAGPSKQNTNAFIFEIATPAEWDGDVPPPDGAPHYSVRLIDDAWGVGNDAIQVWETHYDQENPNNSFVDGPLVIELAPFDANLCGNSIFDCIDQPGNNTVSALQHVVFNRAQYYNFQEYEVLLMNFSVDIGGNLAGVRWLELRKEGEGEWYLYQEGTYAPTEHQSRIQPGIAMDHSGNIALAYTIVDPDSTFLGLRVTGRLAGDSLGAMTFQETSIIEGMSSNPFQRWGDYTSMSVDPIDGKTFWYNGEYMRAGGNWGTRIAKFVLKADSLDLGVFALESPVTSKDLTNEETVTVRYRNYGLTDQSNFTVGLMVDGQLIVEDQIELTVEEAAAFSHTFSIPVDMDEIREYEIEPYVILAGDQNSSNDRRTYKVTKLPRYDAAIINLDGIDPLLCGDSLKVAVTVENVGEENLTSLNLNASLGTAEQTFTYSGDLPSGSTFVHEFLFSGFEVGNNPLAFSVNMPNGFDDENMSNDNASSEFEYDPETARLSLELRPDFYSSETSWELLNEMGEVIVSADYTENDIQSDIRNLCFKEGCFTFVLKDAYGDGWSWGGDPYFAWTDEAGNILAQLDDKNFGAEKSFEFCFPFQCLIEMEVMADDASGPNEEDGVLIAEVFNGISPFEFSIDGGSNFQEDNVFNNLTPGDYEVLVIDANGCETTTSVNIGFMSNNEDLSNEPEVIIAPNPNNGYFELNIKGLSTLPEVMVSLMDQTGSIIYDLRLNNIGGTLMGQFTTKLLPSGTYYLWIKDQNIKRLYKVVKQ